jgi:hypothetical protein
MSRAREVGDLGSVVTVDDGNLIINESGADVDFRVEGDTDANLLFVDASADKVGIGASDPVGKIDCRGILTISNSVSSYWGFDRDDSTGDLTLSNSNTTPVLSFTESGAYLRLASGSGGIQFNGDTAAANALDDYEEGTFTPTYTGASSAGTSSYGNQTGTYTKIGNQVLVRIFVEVSSATGTGTIVFGGLPFTANSENRAAGTVMVNSYNWSGGTYLTSYTGGSAISIRIFTNSDDGAFVEQQVTNEAQDWYITMNYFV